MSRKTNSRSTSPTHFLLLLLFCLLLLLCGSFFPFSEASPSTSSTTLNSLSVSQLQELIERRNFPPCKGCSTKREYVNYLTQLQHVGQMPPKQKEETVPEPLGGLNAQLQELLQKQNDATKAAPNAAKMYEKTLIKGLVHIFGEWVLTVACLVGIFFVLSEMRLFYKSFLMSLLYLIMLGSVSTASSLGMLKYFREMVDLIAQAPNGFQKGIVDWLAHHLWTMDVIAEYHTFATKLSTQLMPIMLLCTARYTLGYSYLLPLLGLCGLEGWAMWKLEGRITDAPPVDAMQLLWPPRLLKIVSEGNFSDIIPQLSSLVLQVLPVFCVVLLILSSMHFTFFKSSEYRPVALSLLTCAAILIFGDLILKHGESITLLQWIESKVHLDTVDIFHLLLSIAMVIVIMITRIPGLQVYKLTMQEISKRQAEAEAKSSSEEQEKKEE